MDGLDQKLLSELQIHGFQKSDTLAPSFGVGSRTIRRRLSAMKNKGLIKIIAVPNPVLLGYRGWAKIGIKVAPEATGNVTHELIEHPSVYFVASSVGKFDFIIAVHFESIERLTYFVNSELSKVAGVISTETMMLICPRKYYNFSWRAPAVNTSNGREDYQRTASSHSYKLDEIDFKIIDALRQDGLARPAELKSRLGISESTVRKRVKEMQKHGVFKIEVAPNPRTLEYEVWATIGIVMTNRSAHEVIDAIVNNPAVYLASVSVGRFNIIIAARFHNIDLLSQFVNVELTRIPGVVAVETFLHTKPLKYHNVKWLLPSNK